MNVEQIPEGAVIALDTNILVYANQCKSQQCIRLLERCAQRSIQGVVPMPMAAELMHTLMLIEARENGWIGDASPSHTLARKPEFVQRLTVYEKQMHQFLAIGLRLEAVAVIDLIESLRIQRESGMLTNDSLLGAVARRLNCDAIASADRAFTRLPGLAVYAPDDLKD